LTVYGFPGSAGDTLTTSDQSSRLREQSYSSLPTINQPSLPKGSTEANNNPSPKNLEESKQILRGWRLDYSSTESSIAEFSELGEVEEQQRDELDQEEDEDSDWLNMASYNKPQTTINDNTTVRHKKVPGYASNNWAIDPGQVITIFGGDEGHLSCRTMVVMARSEELALQCVSLCPHPGIAPHDYKKYSTSHVPVYSVIGAPTDRVPEFKKRILIEFDSKNTTLDNDCFINCQHVWTIRSTVKYAQEGRVQNFKDLLEAFSEIQRKLYKDVRQQAGLED